MSYCIFGHVVTVDAVLANVVLKASAKANGFEILVGSETSQEWLRYDSRRDEPNSLPVFITTADAKDHAESFLFLPNKLFSSSESRTFLHSSLLSLEGAFRQCFEAKGFSSAFLIFTDSQDSSYENLSCSISEIAEMAYQELRIKNYFARFSLRFP